MTVRLAGAVVVAFAAKLPFPRVATVSAGTALPLAEFSGLG